MLRKQLRLPLESVVSHQTRRWNSRVEHDNAQMTLVQHARLSKNFSLAVSGLHQHTIFSCSSKVPNHSLDPTYYMYMDFLDYQRQQQKQHEEQQQQQQQQPVIQMPGGVDARLKEVVGEQVHDIGSKGRRSITRVMVLKSL